MTPQAMLRLVRVMQAQPRIGILQTLVTGLPSASPFARIFQFGMRLGMRSYTLGAASWQGDCGPYWGHNAILRLAPFIEHCKLPVLPGAPPLGGHVLSHDQLEAVLMRRAGYEVRVLPDEEGSWEENPPTLLEFIRRDLRWCQGNMQYFHFLALPRLKPVSRCQVALAIAMYLSAPAWLLFMLLGLIRVYPFRTDLGMTLFFIILAMSLAPKLATLADVLVRSDLRRAYGGAARIVIGALVEFIFSVLIAPVSAVAITLFMLGLPFGRRVGWTSQQRDAEGVTLLDAARKLWPQMLFGALLVALIFWKAAAGTIWYWMPLLAGLLGAVPVAMVTAHPLVGRMLGAAGICRIPEESPFPTEPSPAPLFTPYSAASPQAAE
jgi:membrane glycosyltransferase